MLSYAMIRCCSLALCMRTENDRCPRTGARASFAGRTTNRQKQKYTANEKTWAHPNEIGDSTGLVTLSYTMSYMSDRLPNSLLFPDVIPKTIVRGGRSSHREGNYRANFTLKKVPAPATFSPPTDGDTSH
jgi:hypothetical protein